MTEKEDSEVSVVPRQALMNIKESQELDEDFALYQPIDGKVKLERAARVDQTSPG